jgi:hypothetical protein
MPDIGPDELLSFFDTLALTRRGRRGPLATWVRKWDNPVAVRAEGLAEPEYREALAETLDEISHLSGVPFHPSDRRTRSGNRLIVRYRRHADMVVSSDGAVCRASTQGIDGTIHSGRVEVSVLYLDCLRHELMHALGFDNHWMGHRATPRMPSVLALRAAPARSAGYSTLDQAAIGLLYDRRLRPGMLRERALGLAEGIITRRYGSHYAETLEIRDARS